MTKLLTKIIVGLVILLGCSIAYEKYANTTDEMEQYIQKYNQFKAKAESTNKMVDSLKTVIAVEAKEATIAETKANVAAEKSKKLSKEIGDLKTKTANLKHFLDDSTESGVIRVARRDTIIAHQDTIITQQDELIKSKNDEIFNLRFAMQKKDTVIALLTMSRDSLQTIVKNIPPAPKNPNKMFGITLPSRTTSFIAGTIVGIVVVSAIKH